MKVDILAVDGTKTGRQADLPDTVFAIENPSEHAVYLAVKQYNAHQRQGTHKAKERGEIKGSTRKLKKQKGTGTARAGDIKNPLFRGGGRVFGPRPRTYTVRLNKKVKSLARRTVLSDKAQGGNVIVVEDFTFDAPKTSEFVNVLGNLEIQDQKVLFLTADHDNNLFLSSRNLRTASVQEARNANVYEIINANKLLLSESAVGVLSEMAK